MPLLVLLSKLLLLSQKRNIPLLLCVRCCAPVGSPPKALRALNTRPALMMFAFSRAAVPFRRRALLDIDHPQAYPREGLVDTVVNTGALTFRYSIRRSLPALVPRHLLSLACHCYFLARCPH